ncbi:TPA: YadA-like family protein [Mannheimia haemolytica]
MPNFSFTHLYKKHTKELPAVTLLSALIGLSQVSYANPLPLGNTTGTNNLAVGEGSFALGTGSQAIGKNAIATGGNISPQEFKAELENFRDLVNQIEELRTQIAEQEKQGSVNQQLQDTLKSQIAQYDTILERVREKQAQQAILANSVIPMRKELVNKRNQLTELENNFNTSFLPEKNKQEAYQKFSTVIESLDWNKLSATNGVDQLATDLKTKIETDFPNINFPNDQYKDLIKGYSNFQGNLVTAIPKFLNKVNDDFAISNRNRDSYYNYLPYHTLAQWEGSTFNFRTLNGVYYDDNLTSTELLQAFISQRDSNTLYDLRNTYGGKNYHLVVAKMSYENLKKELSKKPDSTFNKLKKLYETNGELLITGGGLSDYTENSLELLTAPALKESLKNQESFPSRLYRKFNIDNQAIAQTTSNITKEEIDDLEKTVENFNNFKNSIDYDSDDAWIFNKEEYRTHMNDNVIPFMEKVEEFTKTLRALSKEDLSEEERTTKTIDSVKLRIYLNEQARNRKNYINGFVPTDWISEITDQMTESKNLWLKYEEESKTTLKPYKEETISQVIQDEINKKMTEIGTTKLEIANKETELEGLENQINAFTLTDEEKLAEDVKNDLISKLDEAKAALAKNQQTLKEKHDELLGLNNKLDSSPLVKNGKNALAEGTNAFASGENAIAFGTDSQATGNNAIALGANSKANAESAIAIGKGAQALKEKALALGENAIANGASAIAIGDNIGVSGEKAVGIGSNAIVSGNGAISIGSDNRVSHKNAVAIGSNITQTAENSVNLGNESATTVERTAETAGTTQYAHTEILGEIYKFAASESAGVVTVGAKGKERRIQNVAAGLVSETSTDAVNGSQLYAVAKAADEGKIGVVRYTNTDVVRIANHLDGNEVNISNKSGNTRLLTGLSEGLAPTDAVNKAQLDREIGVVNNKISGVEKEVKNVKGSVSNAIAIASLPQVSVPGKRQLSVATGHILGTTSVAVGLNGLSDNGRISYKLGTSVSQNSNFAVGAGIGFSW